MSGIEPPTLLQALRPRATLEPLACSPHASCDSCPRARVWLAWQFHPSMDGFIGELLGAAVEPRDIGGSIYAVTQRAGWWQRWPPGPSRGCPPPHAGPARPPPLALETTSAVSASFSTRQARERVARGRPVHVGRGARAAPRRRRAAVGAGRRQPPGLGAAHRTLPRGRTGPRPSRAASASAPHAFGRRVLGPGPRPLPGARGALHAAQAPGPDDRPPRLASWFEGPACPLRRHRSMRPPGACHGLSASPSLAPKVRTLHF